QTTCLVQQLGEVDVGTPQLFECPEILGELYASAKGADSLIAASKHRKQSVKRVQRIALDLGRPDLAGHADGLLAGDSGLQRLALEHQDVRLAREDAGARGARLLGQERGRRAVLRKRLGQGEVGQQVPTEALVREARC